MKKIKYLIIVLLLIVGIKNITIQYIILLIAIFKFFFISSSFPAITFLAKSIITIIISPIGIRKNTTSSSLKINSIDKIKDEIVSFSDHYPILIDII